MRRVKQYVYHKKLVARGKYGKIYKGYHKKSKKPVAIKTSKYLHLTAKEASMLKKIGNRKYFVSYRNFFIMNGKAYLVMDWVKGRPLGALKKRRWIGNKYSVKRASKLTLHLLKAVKYMHAKGMVHRDIKPPNIMINDRKQIRIIDFGMSLKNRSPRRRLNDIARVAYIMVFMLRGVSSLKTLPHKKKRPIIPASCPVRLKKILRKALHPNKRLRYKKIKNLIKAIAYFAK